MSESGSKPEELELGKCLPLFTQKRTSDRSVRQLGSCAAVARPLIVPNRVDVGGFVAATT
jgi:hypothetical protein